MVLGIAVAGWLIGPMILGPGGSGVELGVWPPPLPGDPPAVSPPCVTAHTYDSRSWPGWQTLRSDIWVTGCKDAQGRLRLASGPSCVATSFLGPGTATARLRPQASVSKWWSTSTIRSTSTGLPGSRRRRPGPSAQAAAGSRRRLDNQGCQATSLRLASVRCSDRSGRACLWAATFARSRSRPRSRPATSSSSWSPWPGVVVMVVAAERSDRPRSGPEPRSSYTKR